MGNSEKTNEGFGTINYASPEILLRIPYGKEIDIWALGILLFLFPLFLLFSYLFLNSLFQIFLFILFLLYHNNLLIFGNLLIFLYYPKMFQLLFFHLNKIIIFLLDYILSQKNNIFPY